jgi:ABC-type sugar transport system ATPase subunit
MNDEVHVEVRGISKRFGGTQAVAEVSIAFERGKIHGLVGENGAGKSTLVKIIGGVYQPDEGQMLVDNRPESYHGPRDAIADGITMIAQELMLQPNRSVAENVFLGIEDSRFGVVSQRHTQKRYKKLSERAGYDVPADAKVGDLPVAVQQQVEILRALARDAKFIIMDEPTAPLTADEAEKLFQNIRRLRERGTTIIYVSHFLEEVLALSDTVSVLRDGKLTLTSPAHKETTETLVTAMLGRPFDLTFPEKVFPPADTPVIVSVEGLSRPPDINNVSFEIKAGEILGFAGLIGSGRTEIVRAVFGADHRDKGKVILDGKELKVRTPHQAIKNGIAMLPESRKDQGLLMRRSITENVSLPHLGEVTRAGIISSKQERREVGTLMDRLDVRASHLSAPIYTLSGGNQQKVLFGKWLFCPPHLLLADEPTRGIDVGAKRAIYELISSLAREGMAVLLISSELEEVLELSHRVLAIRNGQIVEEFDGHSVTMDEILRACFGETQNAEVSGKGGIGE